MAIAEPRPKTRVNFASNFSVDQTLIFNTWRELLEASAETIKTVGKRLCDAVIVAVQDQMHLEVVLAFAEQGYHILCEKPMATSVEHCLRIEDSIKKAGVIFGMGHGAHIFTVQGIASTDLDQSFVIRLIAKLSQRFYVPEDSGTS